MARALSIDLRQRILNAVDEAEQSYPLIAERFSVSVTTVERLVRRRRQGKGLEPDKRSGRRPKLQDEHLAWIDEELKVTPYITSYELAARFNKRFRKLSVHRSTILRAMHDLGFSFKKNPVRASSRPASYRR